MYGTPEEKRKLLTKQKLEVNLGTLNSKVTCAWCRRRVLIRQAYRCYYCRLYFCWTCSKLHFTKPDIR